MSLVVFGHGQNGNHGDGALLAQLTTGTLVHGSQVGVQIAGIAAAAGDFLLSSGDLTQSLGVVGDIGQDDQNVHILLEGQILSGGQSHTGSCDTLDSGVIGQVGKQHGTVNSAGTGELLDEEVGLFEGDTDCSEDDGKVSAFVAQHLGLTGNLSGQIVVRQTGTGEDG